jgi:hypothetical protein
MHVCKWPHPIMIIKHGVEHKLFEIFEAF